MSAELITKLIEAGTPAVLVAEVAMQLARAQAAAETLEKRRTKDRQRKVPRNSTESSESAEFQSSPPDGSPKEIYQTPSLTPVSKTEAKASSKSPVQREKLEAIGSCLRVAFPPPPEVADGVWADFLRSPKRRKAGMSQTAYAGICRNLIELAEHGFPPGEMIALAVERGWTTVKLEWVLNDNDKRTNGVGRNQSSDGLSSTARAGLDVFGPG